MNTVLYKSPLVSDRYTIVGTIRIDPRLSKRTAAALDDSTLERLLLGLAVCETLDQLPSRLTPVRTKVAGIATQRRTFLRANLDALATELQSQWHELEAALR